MYHNSRTGHANIVKLTKLNANNFDENKTQNEITLNDLTHGKKYVGSDILFTQLYIY